MPMHDGTWGLIRMPLGHNVCCIASITITLWIYIYFIDSHRKSELDFSWYTLTIPGSRSAKSTLNVPRYSKSIIAHYVLRAFIG